MTTGHTQHEATTGLPASPTPERRRTLGRRAQQLAGASVTYNVLEAVIAVGAGVAASSIALVGFGLDSVVEVGSGLVILWQFRHSMPETREKRALRLIAISFFALAAYGGASEARAGTLEELARVALTSSHSRRWRALRPPGHAALRAATLARTCRRAGCATTTPWKLFHS